MYSLANPGFLSSPVATPLLGYGERILILDELLVGQAWNASRNPNFRFARFISLDRPWGLRAAGSRQ